VKFYEWKSKTMAKLVTLASSASSEKERSDLTALINDLPQLRQIDLVTWLRLLFAYCDYHKKYEVCKEIASEVTQIEA